MNVIGVRSGIILGRAWFLVWMPLVANEEEDNVMLISGTAAPESSSSTWTRAYGIRLAQQRGLVQSHDQIHLLDERRRRKRRSDADVNNAQATT